MRVAWATETTGIGNAYGYTHGNRWGRRCLEMAGVAIDPDAAVVVHHCPPHAFRPLPGRFNVLWTAWEFPELPDWERGTLSAADLVCVTAQFLVPIFRKYVSAPVRCVHQGIDTDAYYPRPRAWARRYSPRRPFRVLWVGAPNDRKGYQFLLAAWNAFSQAPDMELVMKTTLTDKLERAGNVVFDSRNLSQADMVALYHSADCFAFPSMAEGFGFTLGEAMACGVPCLYTPCTSLNEIAEQCKAIPLACRSTHCFTLRSPDGQREWQVEASEPDVRDLAMKILWIKDHPAEARRIGRAAARHIRQRFTWRQAGQVLRAVLEESVGSLRSPRVPTGAQP